MKSLKAKPKRGRPAKLGKASGAVLDAIEAGHTRQAATASAGIHRATLMRWLARGKLERRGPYRRFVMSLKQTEELRNLTRVLRILERRYHV